MSHSVLTIKDKNQLKIMGIRESQIKNQLIMFIKGSTNSQLVRPAKIKDGIKKFSKRELKRFISIFENSLKTKKAIKFVPASGAATRMFEILIAFQSGQGEITKKEIIKKAKNKEKDAEFFLKFLKGLKRHQFAFYTELKSIMSENSENLDKLIKMGKYKTILDYILTPKGLNYAAQPKALLKFHQYDNNSRTALEEHMIESKEYTRNRDGIARIHFTLSDEFKSGVQNFLGKILPLYESSNTRFRISVSIQKTSTHTVAVDSNNKPLRDDQGKMIFRPGGHGALIENLNELEEDLIFIKNIDNVVPDRLKGDTFIYKKAIAGYLVVIQEQIFHYLRILSSKKISPGHLEEIIRFCKAELYIIFPAGFSSWNSKKKIEFLFKKLNRPIRVCGMVKNQGEPGGGPFWIKDINNRVSMQIIEKSQINTKSAEQYAILSDSSHFNPVDLVCAVRNFQGEKFDLRKYIDQGTYFISEKSLGGKPIKALELPGLWNGAMSNWTSLFVEIPITTFNPVKTVNDLLRKEHQ